MKKDTKAQHSYHVILRYQQDVFYILLQNKMDNKVPINTEDASQQ